MSRDHMGWHLQSQFGSAAYYTKIINGREAYAYFSGPHSVEELSAELSAVERRLGMEKAT